MNTRMAATTLLATALVASPLSGQVGPDDARWSFDLQAGVAAPTAEVQDDELGVGFGFEGNVAFRVATHLSLYAGWDWHRFAPDALLDVADVDLEETGYAFGLRFDHPFGAEEDDGASYRLRAGVTLNHLELEDADGELVDDSGHGAGFEVGAGVFFPLGSSWRIGPEVRYRSLERPLDVGEGEVDVGLDYVAFDLVFSRSF